MFRLIVTSFFIVSIWAGMFIKGYALHDPTY